VSLFGATGARRRFSSSFNLRLPWNIIANTGMTWNRCHPYSLRTGKDDNNDNMDTNPNDRPTGVPRNSLTVQSSLAPSFGRSSIADPRNSGAIPPVCSIRRDRYLT
jgi:hypothetical protein